MTPPGDEPVTAWRPSRQRTVLYGLTGTVLAILALTAPHTPFGPDSALPFGVVAVLLLGLAALDLWFGTPLTADAQGLQISRGPGRVEQISWSEIDRLEATSATHRGLLLLSALEVDVGERLVVLSRHRLGHDPTDVAQALRSMRPSGGTPR
jgi:hypothetical protein